MPTYDYQCSSCGQAFEVFQRMSDEPVSSCPDCGASARRRISGGAGFIFKGEGFYITDHRSQEYRDRAAADAGKEPAAASDAKTAGDGAGESPKKGEVKTAETSSSNSGKTSAGTGGAGSAAGGDSGRSRSASGAGNRAKAGSEP
ncbi:MAG: zinc ribbon domain-containing protein [Gammaproteobacteria bacterium]|nr:zinc ribbon domain-containing protein [Gammaproteobacteria bacterium]